MAELKHHGIPYLFPSDMFRGCQMANVPLDDSDIRLGLRGCSKDEDGRVREPTKRTHALSSPATLDS